LEWFIKNSSCEFVEVNKKLVEFPLTFKMMYKIIIPQEEPKQETVEEAAEKRIPTGTHIWELTETRRCDFIAGAKWQAERSYNEDEVDLLVNELINKFTNWSGSYVYRDKLIEIYEQFKKKA
jgi:hypothetical protein